MRNKEEWKNCLPKLKFILHKVLLFLLCAYTSFLLMPLIKLKFTNPYEILGPSTKLEFNPINNSLRFLFFVFFTSLLFVFSISFFKKARSIKWLRLILVLILTFSFFLGNTKMYLGKHRNIDMYHDGEHLGVGSAIYFFDKKPFKDMVFTHGALTDPLLAYYSFKLFGPSIGSFYLLLSLSDLLTFFVLFFILVFIIEDELLFYLSSIFLFGSVSVRLFFRDSTSFIIILLSYLLIKGKINKKYGLFLLAFISFSTFYISIDRGLYLSLVSQVFWFLYSLVYFYKAYNKLSPKNILNFFRKNWSTLIMYPFGLLTGILFGIAYFGWNSYKEFIKITFLDIPKIKPLIDEFLYPVFSLQSLYPYWIPIFLITFNVSLLLFYYAFFIKKIKKISLEFVFIITNSLLAILSYRNALGRSDLGHILNVLHFVFLSVFFTVDYFLKRTSQLLKSILYLTVFLLFLTPFFEIERIVNPPAYERCDVRIFFSMPKISDNFWLTEENVNVRDFILENTSKSDRVFVFTNEAAYYYLFKRKNPTRFYTVWFAIPNFYQKEVIEDLEAHKPKYIIYQSDYWSNRIDDIPNQQKLKRVNDWILANYELEKKIHSTEILKPRS